MRRIGLVGILLGVGAGAGAGACGGTSGGPASLQPTQTATEKAVAKLEEPAPPPVAPALCVGKRNILRRLASGPLPKAPPALKEVVASLEKGGKGEDDAYKKVAPATVLIAAGTAMGSGVLVGPDLVLTNFHVVSPGAQPDLTFKVSVRTGKLVNGVMELEDQKYEGVVVKDDRVRDLALVKIKDAPKGLPFMTVAKKDPSVGQPVIKIGHPGVGMLWSYKSCQITNIGKADRISRANGFDCDLMSEDLALDPRAKEYCQKNKENVEASFGDLNAGLLVQTDCQLAHGDSGGPLTTPSGELVGLNDLGQESFSWHVHAGELRDFLKSVPSAPARAVPDPWCEGGFESDIADADLDGAIDVAWSEGGRGRALFLDLDQDQFVGKPASSDQPFDAEVAITFSSEGVFVWYDQDDDGSFDFLVHGKDPWSKPAHAFTVSKEGSLTDASAAIPDALLSVNALKKYPDAIRQRFATLIEKLAPGLTTADVAQLLEREPSVPDFLLGGGRTGDVVSDNDGNGKPDAAFMSGPFSWGMLVDFNEDSLGTLKVGENPQAVLNSGAITPEASFIRANGLAWLQYDSNGDKKADTAYLLDPGPLFPTVLMGYRQGPDGKLVESKDDVGKLAVRPELLPGKMSDGIARELFLVVGRDGPLGAFPDTKSVWGGSFLPTAGTTRAVVTAELVGPFPSGAALLMDVDQSSKLDPKSTLVEAVNSGAFVPDFAFVSVGTPKWFYYDTNGDGQFDSILYSDTTMGDRATQAWRVEGDRLVVDEKRRGQKTVLTSTGFEDEKRRAAFKKLAAARFDSALLEDATVAPLKGVRAR